MENRAAATLKALISFYHSSSETELSRFFSDEDQKVLKEVTLNGTKSLEGLLPTESSLAQIHYSWLLPVIKSYPDLLVSYFIDALPDPLPQKLRDKDSTLPSQISPSAAVRRFFNGLLTTKLMSQDNVPLPFIPSNELSPILECSKEELLTLMDFLGLWDLASEFHHIIDRSVLAQITATLSPKKKQYLKLSMKQKRLPTVADPLGLHGLNGDSTKLNKLLHRRGLKRLGLALVGRPESMRWHITHTLDLGRAGILEKYYSSEEDPESVMQMTQQVLDAFNFLRTEELV